MLGGNVVPLLPCYPITEQRVNTWVETVETGEWRVWQCGTNTIMTFYRLPQQLPPGFLSSQNSIKRNENRKNQLVLFIEIEREKMKVINEASK